MAYRREKLQEIIHQEIAQLLQKEFNSSGALLTITGVKLSVDGQYAAVLFSVYPVSSRESIENSLQKSIYTIQQELNKRLRIRPVPKIQFSYDESGEKTSRIDEILRKVKDEELSRRRKNHGNAKRKRPGKIA